mgnify:CR=1 FL=1
MSSLFFTQSRGAAIGVRPRKKIYFEQKQFEEELKRDYISVEYLYFLSQLRRDSSSGIGFVLRNKTLILSGVRFRNNEETFPMFLHFTLTN